MTHPNSPINPILELNNHPSDMFGNGLTKREFFAAMAMKALISTENFNVLDSTKMSKKTAQIAIGYADALIAELNKTNKQ